MVQDSSYPQRERNGSARLYRSDDDGQSWAEIFVDEADEDIRRSMGVHQWSISFSDTDALAICTGRGVFVSRGLRGPFQEVLDLPFGAFFGGCAFDAEGMLWVVGTHGVHRRSPLTSAVNEELYTITSSCSDASDRPVYHNNKDRRLHQCFARLRYVNIHRR
jgi:hypothetical protein